MNRDIQGSRQKHSNRDTGTGTWTGKEWDRNTDRDRWTQTGLSLAKPDPSIARGSGRKPILRFVPAAGILQSNQIAERAITTY